MSRKLLLINGPNLNLLGTREPEKYGSSSLKDIENRSKDVVREVIAAKEKDIEEILYTYQSNHEGDIVDRIQKAREEEVGFIVINAGAFTHTSVAIRDALLAVDIPFIELHITNVHKREAFRHTSLLADKAVAVISGLGVYGYEASLIFASNYVK
ncbi:uncharacterized protein PRCAT00000018001 [Priceomyces carsonii]|uniref:uncharacterized protein n=1 Tax=Priceomyces carsonii TaxID=28549 RepID=UPI002ED79217|nr:unnamed protein product [Priceomyces carsonii]